MSSMMSMAIKHPVLPAPALKKEKTVRACVIQGLQRRKQLDHRHSCLLEEAAPLSPMGWLLCVAKLLSLGCKRIRQNSISRKGNGLVFLHINTGISL